MHATLPLTTAQVRANRRNGRLSRGPKTTDGRRRSALNFRELKLSSQALAVLERQGATPRDFYRIWRDVLAVFAFMGPELETGLGVLAWIWWLKLRFAERGEPDFVLRKMNVRLEKHLGQLLALYRMKNRKWRYMLRCEFGPALESTVEWFRMAVESRLSCYQSSFRSVSEESQLDEILNECMREMQELGISADEFGLD